MSYLQVPREEWITLIKDAHPAYISWDQYEENLRRIRDNAIAYNNIGRKTPPREGSSVLQGLAICGKCGQRMTIRYKYRAQSRTDPVYLCQRARIERGAQNCQYIPGACADEAIGNLLIDSATPLTLEEAWNEKLRDLEAARNQYEKHFDSAGLTREEQESILGLAKNFPKLWRNLKAPLREKKRMIRLLLEDVTMIKEQEVILHVRFKGGATKTLKTPLPPEGWQHALTSGGIVKLIDELMNHHSYLEIAQILNERGYKSGTGRQFSRQLIGSIRVNYDLKTRYARLRKAGKLTAREMADLLGITTATVRKWAKRKTLRAYPYNDRNECLHEHPGINSPLMTSSLNALNAKPFIN